MCAFASVIKSQVTFLYSQGTRFIRALLMLQSVFGLWSNSNILSSGKHQSRFEICQPTVAFVGMFP